MTCIVALAGPDFAVMAADRKIVDGWIYHHASKPKIVRTGGWLLGSTGPIRVNNAVKHSFEPPPHPAAIDEAWMVRTFVPALIAAMTKAGMAVIEGWLGGKEGEQQGTILCACPGALFTVQADWAVDHWSGPCAAIGTGQRYALAAHFAAVRMRMPQAVADHVHIAKLAVRAAGRFDIFCGEDPVDTLAIDTINEGEL